jgi:hypothetical protein
MNLRLLLLAWFAACGTAFADEGFKGIRCDADIAKALTGRHLSDERTEATEARHQNLGLKNLGAEELDWGNEEWWRICGVRYALLLDKHDIIRDVLKIPAPAGTALFEGSCKGGQGDVIAVVEASAGTADLAAQAAWKIDDAGKRFVAVPAAGLSCPRNGLLSDGQ